MSFGAALLRATRERDTVVAEAAQAYLDARDVAVDAHDDDADDTPLAQYWARVRREQQARGVVAAHDNDADDNQDDDHDDGDDASEDHLPLGEFDVPQHPIALFCNAMMPAAAFRSRPRPSVSWHWDADSFHARGVAAEMNDMQAAISDTAAGDPARASLIVMNVVLPGLPMAAMAAAGAGPLVMELVAIAKNAGSAAAMDGFTNDIEAKLATMATKSLLPEMSVIDFTSSRALDLGVVALLLDLLQALPHERALMRSKLGTAVQNAISAGAWGIQPVGAVLMLLAGIVLDNTDQGAWPFSTAPGTECLCAADLASAVFDVQCAHEADEQLVATLHHSHRSAGTRPEYRMAWTHPVAPSLLVLFAASLHTLVPEFRWAIRDPAPHLQRWWGGETLLRTGFSPVRPVDVAKTFMKAQSPPTFEALDADAALARAAAGRPDRIRPWWWATAALRAVAGRSEVRWMLQQMFLDLAMLLHEGDHALLLSTRAASDTLDALQDFVRRATDVHDLHTRDVVDALACPWEMLTLWVVAVLAKMPLRRRGILELHASTYLQDHASTSLHQPTVLPGPATASPALKTSVQISNIDARRLPVLSLARLRAALHPNRSIVKTIVFATGSSRGLVCLNLARTIMGNVGGGSMPLVTPATLRALMAVPTLRRRGPPLEAWAWARSIATCCDRAADISNAAVAPAHQLPPVVERTAAIRADDAGKDEKSMHKRMRIETDGEGSAGFDADMSLTQLAAAVAETDRAEAAFFGGTRTVPALAVPALAVPALAVPALAVPALAVPALAVPARAMPARAMPAPATLSVSSTKDAHPWRGRTGYWSNTFSAAKFAAASPLGPRVLAPEAARMMDLTASGLPLWLGRAPPAAAVSPATAHLVLQRTLEALPNVSSLPCTPVTFHEGTRRWALRTLALVPEWMRLH